VSEFLLHFGLSNLLVSIPLALLAWGMQSYGRAPRLAHLLWILVLFKLITPPLIEAPILPSLGSGEVAQDGENRSNTDPLPPLAPIPAAKLSPTADSSTSESGSAFWQEQWSVERGVLLIWLFGSCWILLWSVGRVVRFHRLLRQVSGVAEDSVQELARVAANSLNLAQLPTIWVTQAHISPMVWWVGRDVRVILPQQLCDELSRDQLHWVLAHELAHVKRGDHFVRWLEWWTCIAFWWNPVVWWTRRNLRASEEVCCDALVLRSSQQNSQAYADSLLSVVEFLASPAIRPPALASEINSGGFLESRFQMIVNPGKTSPSSLWLRTGLILAAVALIPLGVVFAHPQVKDAVNDLPEGIEERLNPLFADNGFTDEQIDQVMGVMGKFVDSMKQEKNFKSKVWDQWFASKPGLNQDQIDLVYRIAKRLSGGAAAKSKDKLPKEESAALYERIGSHLLEQGLTESQVDMVLKVMPRFTASIKKSGEDFEPSPRALVYLSDEIGLNDDQIDLVLRMAKRVAHAKKQTNHFDEWVIPMLKENGFNGDQAKTAVGVLRRFGAWMRETGGSEDPPQEMIAGFEERLLATGVTEEQLEVVREIAEKLYYDEEDHFQEELYQLFVEHRFSEEQIEQVFALIERIKPRLEPGFEPSEEMIERVENFLFNMVELSEEQVELVFDLFERWTYEDKADEKVGVDQVLDHLERALEEGEITPEELRRRIGEMMRRLKASEKKGSHDGESKKEKL